MLYQSRYSSYDGDGDSDVVMALFFPSRLESIIQEVCSQLMHLQPLPQ